MTSDWWNTPPSRLEEGPVPVRPQPVPEPVPPRPAEPPEEIAQATADPGPEKPDRRKGLILGAAGAAAVGVLMFTVLPHDGGGPSDLPGASVTTSQEAFPPAAGGDLQEGGKEGGTADQTPAEKEAPKVVSLSAVASGSGSVGAVMEVTITNDTDDTILVMSSMVKGDGQAAIIGEGTLAPGSRTVGPGEEVTGTVEFAAKNAPSQVVLMDIGGNVVAANG